MVVVCRPPVQRCTPGPPPAPAVQQVHPFLRPCDPRMPVCASKVCGARTLRARRSDVCVPHGQITTETATFVYSDLLVRSFLPCLSFGRAYELFKCSRALQECTRRPPN